MRNPLRRECVSKSYDSGGLVGWGDGADRASYDADVSITLPKIPYGGFSPVRLQGQPVRCDLPTRTVRNRERQLPACSSARDSFVITLRTPQPSEEDQALRPSRSRASACRCARGSPLYPRGPWLRHEFCCLAPSSLTPTPSASPTGTRQLHGLAGYMPRLRCAGAPRRPAGPSLLSLPCCPDVPSTIRRWVQRCRPVARAHPGARLPRFVPESPPTRARLCRRRGIVRFMLRPVCLPRPPDWLRPDGVTCAPPGV